MYIDAGLGQSNPIILTTITSGPNFPRTWRIRISQIHCGSIFKADQGCLQYHTGVSGRIKSFNFDSSSGRQLSNQDYSICIRNERNFCSIQYSTCPDPIAGTSRSRSFTLSGNSNTGEYDLIIMLWKFNMKYFHTFYKSCYGDDWRYVMYIIYKICMKLCCDEFT
jgi:hypothetical protein